MSIMAPPHHSHHSHPAPTFSVRWTLFLLSAAAWSKHGSAVQASQAAAEASSAGSRVSWAVDGRCGARWGSTWRDPGPGGCWVVSMFQMFQLTLNKDVRLVGSSSFQVKVEKSEYTVLKTTTQEPRVVHHTNRTPGRQGHGR